jgi:hypothetical protein
MVQSFASAAFFYETVCRFGRNRRNRIGATDMEHLISVNSLTEPLSRAQVQHYTAYKAKPFKREDRDKVTILYGGLTP